MDRYWRLLVWLAASLAMAAAMQPGDGWASPAKAGRLRHTQIGRASFYGPRHGHPRTASGARLHAGAMTAASPNLPLGTRAKVTSLDTGKSVHVVVTDRGPYAKGRILDVSRAAADRLGMKEQGVSTVAVKPTASPAPS